MLKENDTPRQQWPLAKVAKCFPYEKDGIVRTFQLMVPTEKATLKGLYKNPFYQNKVPQICIATYCYLCIQFGKCCYFYKMANTDTN